MDIKSLERKLFETNAMLVVILKDIGEQDWGSERFSSLKAVLKKEEFLKFEIKGDP